MDIYCILCYNPIALYLFSCSNFSSFGHWELFWLTPVSRWHTPSLCFVLLWLLGTFLLPGITRCSRLIFCVSPYPSPRFSPFSKETWFLWFENIRSQDLDVRCACCCWGGVGSTPLRKGICVCILTCYIHVCEYFCVWPPISILR